MRPLLPLFPLALLAACAEPRVAAAPDSRAAQEAACTAAIAAHVGRPASEITSRRIGDAANGGATVEAVDGNRRHLCEVDASARVLGYSHPR